MKSEIESEMEIDMELEEILLNQWQPLQTMLYDGWVLRFANGYTKRANSVNPIYFSTKDIDEKIAFCEAVYAANQMPTVFKITPFVQPPDLDERLEQKGYLSADHASVQTRSLEDIKEPVVHTVHSTEQVSDDWLDQYCLLKKEDARYKTTMKLMLSNQLSLKGFFTLYNKGEVAACGLGMVERGTLGIFDIVTREQDRNQGFGEQLMLHILQWGKSRGAKRSDLQVIDDNEPAKRLYAKLGFREMYRYWYRIKPR